MFLLPFSNVVFCLGLYILVNDILSAFILDTQL